MAKEFVTPPSWILLFFLGSLAFGNPANSFIQSQPTFANQQFSGSPSFITSSQLQGQPAVVSQFGGNNPSFSSSGRPNSFVQNQASQNTPFLTSGGGSSFDNQPLGIVPDIQPNSNGQPSQLSATLSGLFNSQRVPTNSLSSTGSNFGGLGSGQNSGSTGSLFASVLQSMGIWRRICMLLSQYTHTLSDVFFLSQFSAPRGNLFF